MYIGVYAFLIEEFDLLLWISLIPHLLLFLNSLDFMCGFLTVISDEEYLLSLTDGFLLLCIAKLLFFLFLAILLFLAVLGNKFFCASCVYESLNLFLYFLLSLIKSEGILTALTCWVFHSYKDVCLLNCVSIDMLWAVVALSFRQILGFWNICTYFILSLFGLVQWWSTLRASMLLCIIFV